MHLIAMMKSRQLHNLYGIWMEMEMEMEIPMETFETCEQPQNYVSAGE